jgi:hypothetical protein
VLASKALVAYAEMGNCAKAAAAVGVAPGTVLAIAERNPDEFGIIKNERARQHFRMAGRLLCSLDRMKDEAIDAITPYNRTLMSAIHSDKGIALTAKDPPTIFDYDGLNKVIRMHDVLMAELSRRSEPINVTPTKEIASAEVPRGEATQGVREQPPRDIRDNEQNRGDARLEDHTQGPPDGSQTS